MNRKDYKELCLEWNKNLNEILTHSKIDIEDENIFPPQSYEDYEKLSKENTEFIEPITDLDKIERVNSKNPNGVNSKIFEIIKKLEDIVQYKRDFYGEPELTGKIYIYEDNSFNSPYGFVKYFFKDLEEPGESEETKVWGMVEFEKTFEEDEEHGYHQHMMSRDTKRGFGPLLFELFLEYVSRTGSAVVCDRNSITPEAQKRFMVYAVRNDVEKIQLDISESDSEEHGFSKLHPNKKGSKGSTSQNIAIRHMEKDWSKSIYSKALKKDDLKTFEYISKYSDHLEIIMDVPSI
tara:strand:+ start:352 stop:1227 length:876 start_codon:yes stop_codon:yes gene_type:complete